MAARETMATPSDARASQAREASRGPTRSRSSAIFHWLVPMLLFSIIAGAWGANTGGLASSNDGSHFALTRALGLYGDADIDEEAALTLRVDLAQRNGHYYSDRPPGTAFLAIPSVALGHRWDESLLRRSQAVNETVVRPASAPFERTYYKRGNRPPRLVLMMGSILGANLHAMAVGLLGFAFLWFLLARRGVDLWGRTLIIATLAAGTLWGPYSTVLFSHVSAAMLVSGYLLGLEHLRTESDGEGRMPSPKDAWIVGGLTGLAGAWAVACDYLLIVAIVPLALVGVHWRRWPALLVGALPMIIAVLAYHTIAFGSPTSIGYDHHANFEFARARGSTFDGDLIDGLGVLWGTRRGAGMLSMSPVSFAGFIALPAAIGLQAWRARTSVSKPAPDRVTSPTHRAMQVLAWMPWVFILALHHTPEGGVGVDHRYLIPILPMVALGLGEAWCLLEHPMGRTVVGLTVGVLALWSASRVWPHFFQWHEAAAFEQPLVGLGAAGAISAIFVLPRIVAFGFGRDQGADGDTSTP